MLAGSAVPVVRAQVALVKGAPFKATWTRVTKTPGGARHELVPRMMLDDPPLFPGEHSVPVPAPMVMRPAQYQGVDVHREKIEVARASDGSLYEKTTIDGNVTSIAIYDVQHGRVIEENRSGVFITTQPVTALSIPEQHEMLENKQKTSDATTGIAVEHTTPLGEKTEKGMTLFGLKSDFKYGDGTTSEEEVWTSDTGLTTLLSDVDSKKRSMKEKLVSFHAGEPNAGLFRIPKKLPSDLNRQYIPSDFGSGYDHFTYPPGGAPQ